MLIDACHVVACNGMINDMPTSLVYHLSDVCHVVACTGMTCPSLLLCHLSDVCHVVASNGMIYDMSVIVDVSSQ